MAHNNRCGALLQRIKDKLAEIPPIGINHLVLAGLLHLEDLALRSAAKQLSTCLTNVDVAGVVMPKLHNHKISRLQGIVDLCPSPLVKECARTAACHGMILYHKLLRVKKISYHGAPAPHAILIGIGILDSAVSYRKQHRNAFLAGLTCLCVNCLRKKHLSKRQILIIADPLYYRLNISPCSKLAGMDAVKIEHRLYLLLAKFLKLCGCYLIEVDKRHLHLLSHLFCPASVGLIAAGDNGAVGIIPGVAGCKRHKDGICPLGLHIPDILTHIFPIGVYCLFLSGFLDSDIKCLFPYSGNGCPGAALVIGAIVVMSQLYDYPVTFLHTFQHISP